MSGHCRRSRSYEVEEGDGGGAAGCSASLGSSETKMKMLRSLCTWQKDEGVALDSAAANGGGGRFWMRAGERTE